MERELSGEKIKVSFMSSNINLNNILPHSFVCFMKNDHGYMPFFSINKRKMDIYINYLLIDNHLSLHYSFDPNIKHSRINNTKNNFFETQVGTLSSDNFDFIDGYALGCNLLQQNNCWSKTIIDFFDQSKIGVIDIDFYKKEGWFNDSGLGFEGLVINTSDYKFQGREIEVFKNKYHIEHNKQFFWSFSCGDKTIILSIYNCEDIGSGAIKMNRRIDMQASTKQASAILLFNMFTKSHEDNVIAKNDSWVINKK